MSLRLSALFARKQLESNAPIVEWLQEKCLGLDMTAGLPTPLNKHVQGTLLTCQNQHVRSLCAYNGEQLVIYVREWRQGLTAHDLHYLII